MSNANDEIKKTDSPAISPLEKKVEILTEKAGLHDIDLRLQNVEKLHDTVKHITDSALISWGTYLTQKTESEKKSRDLEDAQHKRSSYVLVYVITLIVGFCIIAMLKGQIELAKMILTSSLAVAAGAGMSSFLRSPKSKDK